MNTVISTKNFCSVQKSGKAIFSESVLVSVIPSPGSEYEKQLINFVKTGGKLMVYGPVTYASNEFLDLLNMKLAQPISGNFSIKTSRGNDQLQKQAPTILHHIEKMSGGGIETVIANPSSDTRVLAQVFQMQEKRDVALFRQNKDWKGGAVCYVRGTNSASYKGGHLLTPDDPEKWFSGSVLMRQSLAEFGYSVSYNKQSAGIKDPINCISRHDNAYWFSGYVPNLTVEQSFHFLQGAPLIIGCETELKDGASNYRFPKAFFKECRAFVEQKDGIISCFEIHSGEKGISRRIGIKGLENATVRVYPPHGITTGNMKAYLNTGYPYKEGFIAAKEGSKYPGKYVVYENITGQLIVSW